MESKNNEINQMRYQLEEMEKMNTSLNMLQDRVSRLANENKGMED